MTTFNGFPVVGQTQHFLVTVVDTSDTDALNRAQAILATCEADLTKLESWFSCVFNPGNAVWVQVDHGSQGAGASNQGYNSNGSSQITINGTSKTVASDVARMLFVAELIEILMGYTGYGWNAGNSAGEALSRVAAAEFYPFGYYSPSYGPYVNGWLQSTPRPDWVSNTEGTDEDAISFGCGIVFLYFLVYQLGFSFTQVITAGGSNANLAQIFATLTKQPASSAFNVFIALLNQHLPSGETAQVPRDNVFPLLDPSHRHIAFASSWQMISSTEELTPLEITLEVCHGSPKTYTYRIEDVVTQISVKAFADGYADAAFTWSVNGTSLPWSGGTTAVSAMVPVTITDTLPLSTENPVPGTLPIQYFVVNQWNTSTLVIRNAAFPGNATIDITARAIEVLVNDPPTTHTETLALPMRTYDMGDDYWSDAFNCRGKVLREMARAVAAVSDSITVLKNTPDPSPEQLIALAASAARYVQALRDATQGVIGLRNGTAALSRQMRQAFVPSRTSELPGIAGGWPVVVRTNAGEAEAGLLPGREKQSPW